MSVQLPTSPERRSSLKLLLINGRPCWKVLPRDTRATAPNALGLPMRATADQLRSRTPSRYQNSPRSPQTNGAFGNATRLQYRTGHVRLWPFSVIASCTVSSADEVKTDVLSLTSDGCN